MDITICYIVWNKEKFITGRIFPLKGNFVVHTQDSTTVNKQGKLFRFAGVGGLKNR